jgi:hypothetical protein
MSQGTLSFVEQEELNNLQKQSSELERQVELTETLKKNLQDSVNLAALNASQKVFSDTSFYSGQTAQQASDAGGETGQQIGTMAGYAVGKFILSKAVTKGVQAVGAKAGAALGAKAGAALGSVAPGIGNAIGLVAGTIIGGLIGKAIGSSNAESKQGSEKSVTDVMNNMRVEREALDKARNEAYEAYTKASQSEDLKKKWEDAQSALANYDATMAQHISQVQQYLNSIDPDTLENKADKAYYDQMQRWVDNYTIMTGGPNTKAGIIAREFETDELKELKTAIEDVVHAGEELNIAKLFDDEDSYRELLNHFADIEIYETDLENYFEDLRQAEIDAFTDPDAYPLIKQLKSITDQVNTLKDAFSEFKTEGKVSAATIVDMYDDFNKYGDAWTEWVLTASTGTTSIEDMEKATVNLGNAIIDSSLDTYGEKLLDKTSKEYQILVGQLQDLGIEDAIDFADAKIATDAIEKAITEERDTLEEVKEYLEEDYGDILADGSFDEIIQKKIDEQNVNKNKEIIVKNKSEYDSQLNAYNTAKNKQDLYNMNLEALKDYADLEFDDDWFELHPSGEDVIAYSGAFFKIPEDLESQYNDMLTEYLNNGMTDKVSDYIDELSKYVDKEAIIDTGFDEELDADSFFDFVKTQNWWSDEYWNGFVNLYDKTYKMNQDGYNNKLPDITAPVITEADVKQVEAEVETAQKAVEDEEIKVGLYAAFDFDDFDENIDAIQEAYSSMSDIVKQYNKNGFLTLDNLQALLNLQPEYLAMLQLENGQLTINQTALETMIQTRLNDAKAEAVQKAIKELNAIAARKEAIEITNASNAAANSINNLNNLGGALNNVTLEFLKGAASANTFYAAVAEADANPYVNDEEWQSVINQMNDTLNMIDDIGANLHTNFNTIVNPDSNSDSDSDDDQRLENIQKKYEGKISNLENQKSWLENEIAREEEIGAGVSKAYYEEQIKLNDKLSEQYEKQRADLIELRKVYPEGSEKWYEVSEAIWEMDHALQEVTTDAIKASKSIIDLYTDIFEKIGEAFSDKSNISEKRIASMENYAELLDLRGSTATKGLFDTTIAEYDTQLATKWDQFYAQQDIYDALVATRDQYTPDSDAWVYYNQQVIAAHNGLMDVKDEIQSIEIAQEQKRDEFKELATQRWDAVQEAYANRDQYYQNQIDLNDKYISKLETLGINVPDEVYEEQINSLAGATSSKWDQYLQARQEMLDYESIYGADSQEYIDKYNETIQLHHAYLDSRNEIFEKRQQIFDNQIERFNQVVERITNATQRMQNISSLLDDKDVATEDGEWTSEGLTRLGMAYQQMEYYKQASDEVAEKMEKVERQYQRGEISEKKYYETMQELENQQWEMINSSEEMKDAIIDIAEARIDEIEEGINKEIEAYQELIDLKKEELDAERDLYDFKKNVEKQTKDIAALERRIASMGGSTDAATIAERTKLEAELREAKEGLDDTYYGHAMDSQSKALDDEIDAYTKNAEDYIESLRESLKDTDLIIEQIFQQVMKGSNTVLETVYTLSETYKFPIDQNLTDPWENATKKSLNFATYAKGHIDNIYDYVNGMKGSLAESLGDPYNSLTKDDMGNPLYEFSWYAAKQIDKVIGDNTTKQDAMKSSLEGGFTQAKSSIEGWGTFASGAVQNVINKFTNPENGLIAALNKTADRINSMPNYDGGYTVLGGDGNGFDILDRQRDGDTTKPDPAVTALQEVLNLAFGETLSINGKYGSATKTAVKNAQLAMKAAKIYGGSIDGLYGSNTQKAMTTFISQEIQNMRMNGSGSSMMGQGIQQYQNALKKIPAAIYAKGTLGTTHDQLAITDESWIGEEITLAAGKNGQLQYLKKGSAVMPADISANLVEWGKLNPEMMKIGGGANLNMISNAVNKPELNFSFDSLVHVDNCSQDTLKDLEKMVDTKITQFNKQLNQSLRKFK